MARGYGLVPNEKGGDAAEYLSATQEVESHHQAVEVGPRGEFAAAYDPDNFAQVGVIYIGGLKHQP